MWGSPHLKTLMAACICALPAGLCAQEQELFRGANLVVAITGQIGATPAFGAGIVFARERDRLYIVTANHVVRVGGAAAEGVAVRLRSWPDKVIPAKLLPQNDAAMDIAVLAIDGLAARGVNVCDLGLDRLAAQDSAKRGEDVYAVGNPNGMAWAMPVRPDAISEVSAGQIVFQSTLLARGHSGGGLLTAQG